MLVVELTACHVAKNVVEFWSCGIHLKKKQKKLSKSYYFPGFYLTCTLDPVSPSMTSLDVEIIQYSCIVYFQTFSKCILTKASKIFFLYLTAQDFIYVGFISKVFQCLFSLINFSVLD